VFLHSRSANRIHTLEIQGNPCLQRRPAALRHLETVRARSGSRDMDSRSGTVHNAALPVVNPHVPVFVSLIGPLHNVARESVPS
jgi:hypothetical protein